MERLVFRNTPDVLFSEALFLTFLICFRANKFLNSRIGQQTVDIVVVPEKIYRESSRFLLLPEFGGYRLKLFDQRIGRMIAFHL